MSAEFFPKLKIGSIELANPLVLAPMAGISNWPFRLLAREQGCALAFTEMISADGLVRNFKKSAKFLRRSPQEKPLGVQIFGSRPEIMAAAASLISTMGADILDINMGCPVKKVVGGGAGAALLMNLPLAKQIIRAVWRAISIPLTVKIRLGWDEQNKNYLQIAQMAEEEGVDCLIIHGRTRAQGYNIKADWQAIAEARRRITIPVIGNGDLNSPPSIINFLQETGCAGAMIGRGALGKPWIFKNTLALAKGEKIQPPSLLERERIIHRHLQMLVDLLGEVKGVKEFRKHLIWYTQGLPGNASFRAELSKWQRIDEVLEGTHKYLQRIDFREIT